MTEKSNIQEMNNITILLHVSVCMVNTDIENTGSDVARGTYTYVDVLLSQGLFKLHVCTRN